jgi:hypothetical protein
LPERLSIRPDALVAITPVEFVRLLTQSRPATGTLVAEHLSDTDSELLLHLLIADVRRFSVERFEADNTGALHRCLDVVHVD